MTTLYERGPLLCPTLRNAVVNERILPNLDTTPIANLGGKAIGTVNANEVISRHDVVQPIQHLVRRGKVLNLHRIVDDVDPCLLIEERLLHQHRLIRSQRKGCRGCHLALQLIG